MNASGPRQVQPLLKRLSNLSISPCAPPTWARGGHLQTILAHLLPSSGQANNGQPLIINLPDGDRLTADYYLGTQDKTLLYLFHGLGGHTQSDYMRRMARLGVSKGFHVLSVNHRGCGSGRGLASYPYHSGRAEDISAAIQYGRKHHPNKRHIAIGFSLSGNALLLLQAGFRGKVQPDFAISVNAPIRLDQAAHSIKEGFNRLYDMRFVRRCQKAVKDRIKDGLIQETYHFPFLNTLYGFDKIYTAPAGGFKDRYDYYNTCSAEPYLEKINSPTIAISSKDDPMVDVTHYRNARYSPYVLPHIETHGGHMGYLNRRKTPLGTRRWLDYALAAYIDGFLK